MAKTKNSVQLIGYLGADPILRKAVNGKSYTKFRVATDYYRRKPDGSIVRKVIWHTIMVWNHLAEALLETFIKGSHVLIEGSIRNEKSRVKMGCKCSLATSWRRRSLTWIDNYEHYITYPKDNEAILT